MIAFFLQVYLSNRHDHIVVLQGMEEEGRSQSAEDQVLDDSVHILGATEDTPIGAERSNDDDKEHSSNPQNASCDIWLAP